MIDYKSLEVGDLTAASINSNIHKGAIVKGIIYDTSKDSDGGAWRKRCQGKSWYTETLGGTNWLGQVPTAALAWAAPGAVPGSYFQNSTDGLFYQLGASSPTVAQVYRGNVREFPAVVAIVAESSRVVIYDLTQGGSPMWFVSTVTFITSVAAIQGSVMIGRGPAARLTVFDFLKDFLWSIDNISTTGIVDKIGSQSVHTWSPLATLAPDTSRKIVSASVNDVATTVLDTAPIDPATGLPVPTIAVATAGGVSVIKDDGTVVNSSQGWNFSSVAIKDGLLLSALVGVSRYYISAKLSALAAGWSVLATGDMQPTLIPSVLAGSSSRFANGSSAHGGTLGLTEVQLNPATPSKGMVNYITNAYNSGWMPGDIRGAYLADTTAETVTASGELVTNGTFTTDTSGWTTSNSTFVASAGAGVLTNTAAVAGWATTAISCVVGRTYTVSLVHTAGTSATGYVRVGTAANAFNISVSNGITGAFNVSFTATVTTIYITIGNTSAVSGNASSFDDVSVKLAEPDRSVKNKGLVVNGTLTKTAVASGAGLVAYSGFSASNYLEQPYNSDLDFGTGDTGRFAWIKFSATAAKEVIWCRDSATTGVLSRLQVDVTTSVLSFTMFDGTTTRTATGTVAIDDGIQHLVETRYSAGTLTIMVDGVSYATATGAALLTMNNATAVLRVGVDCQGANPATNGNITLFRVSATVASNDQSSHIYRTELPLFQANAQCTIAGTSTNVTALAYDDVADELHLGTSWGRSEFKDLLRVASEATTTGSITSLSANEGVVLTGGTSAKVYAPAMYLRDELRRKDVARKALGRVPAFFDYTATASQTAFVAPKGFTVKALYKNGTLMREATTGVYWTRSNDGFQETATLSVGATVSDWISLMCVRA